MGVTLVLDPGVKPMLVECGLVDVVGCEACEMQCIHKQHHNDINKLLRGYQKL